MSYVKVKEIGMVKWTTPHPCLGASETVSNYTITLNFVKESFVDIEKKIDLQSQENHNYKNNFKIYIFPLFRRFCK